MTSARRERMEAVAIHPAFVDPAQRSARRKGWLLLAVAALVGVIGWAGGLFNGAQDIAPVTDSHATTSTDSHLPVPAGVAASEAHGTAVPSGPMPLLLTGTLPGRNSREGQAMIGINKDHPQTYAAGAILANGARIAEIYTDHVVLEKDGETTPLYLVGSNHPAASQSNSRLLITGGETVTTPPKVTSHEILTDYIRPSPVYDGATLKGFQVYAGQYAGIFAQLGLQNGDVITSINGVPLSEPSMAVEQLRLISQGYAVTATVNRGAQQLSVGINGALIQQHEQSNL